MEDAVIWQLVECGGYNADLPLWRELAEREDGPVLDLGAGIGRVALDLADHGHEIVALDVDPVLLAGLRDAAGGDTVETVVADARDFSLDRTFGLVLAPMQTVQLLGDARGRASMLATVRRHLRRGGLFAAALANTVETFGEFDDVLPDVCEVEGIAYFSRPTAVRDAGDAYVVERLREHVAANGDRVASEDRVRLERVSADELASEAAAFGFAAEATRFIAPTDDHIGSEVAMLRG